jgi:NAD(P)-dependent dehydrogenase (short-subunit alcohol dehydrogenase family)
VSGPDRQNVLITGCSSGIGAYLAGALHERGRYRVFATARGMEALPDRVFDLMVAGISR